MKKFWAALLAAGLLARPAAAADFEYYIIKTAQEWRFAPAAAVIVENGGVRLLRGYGQREESETICPAKFVTGDSVFQAGSLAKGLAAELASALEREGLISLCAPVSDYLPYPNMAGLSILDILNHQNPLYPYSGGAMAFFGLCGADMLNALDKLLEKGGERGFNYQNITFCAFEAIVERAAGLSYERAMEKYVLAPLGMGQTGFGAAHFCGENAVSGNFYEGEGIEKVEDERILSAVYAFNAAAGLNTTAGDMGKWLEHLINTREKEPEDGYSLGWFIKDKIYYNVGTAFGSECAAAFSPREGRGIAVFFASSPSPAYRLVMDYFFGEAGEGFIPFSAGASGGDLPGGGPVSALSDYTGIYENKIYPAAQITDEGGRIALWINGARLSLSHIMGDYFAADIPKEAARLLGGDFGVAFLRGEGGEVAGFDLSPAAMEGAGAFTLLSR